MLVSQRWSQRVARRPSSCIFLQQKQRRQSRQLSHGDNGRAPRQRSHAAASGEGKSRNLAQRKSTESGNKKLSLVEQLFPEESKRYDTQQTATRDVPRLPIADKVQAQDAPEEAKKTESSHRPWWPKDLREEMKMQGSGDAILVLRNASLNLTEEDFRRLIPQGRHIEGWTLKEGDIIKVIPWRDPKSLARENVYYLLFSSPLSAFTYQGHVTRIHTLAAMYTPSSLSSPIPPPPGQMVEGLDVHAAIAAYTLVSPSQRLELRQIKPPLKPKLEALIRYQGIPSLVRRKNKMPFEVRLTMEGAQLQPSVLRYIFQESGKSRALSWSGGGNMQLEITRWEPKADSTARTDDNPLSRLMQAAGGEIQQQKRRTPLPVYIVGFHTEAAALSFVTYWHRRPLELPDSHRADPLEGDSEPIANAELLW